MQGKLLAHIQIACILTAAALITAAAAFSHQDIAPFNRFAEAYNAYVAIDPRINDLKALKRMRDEWRALEKTQGWPREKPCVEKP